MNTGPLTWLAWLQRIPGWLPGKTRVARRLLRERLTDADVDLRTPDGLTLTVPSLREPIAFHLLINGVYEPDVVDVILTNLPPHGTYVDVGANIGALALVVARRRPRECRDRLYDLMCESSQSKHRLPCFRICITMFKPMD